MSAIVSHDAVGIVTDLLGFRPEPTRIAEVEGAVEERMKRRSARDFGVYRALLDDPLARAVEARALADRLTINETYFFREYAHHRVLRDVVVPAHAKRRSAPLRILSLGCSTGEEPYGLAMTLREAGLRQEDARILAIDASANAIAKAERGRFSEWSLRNVDQARRERYFVSGREGFVLSDEIRSWVRFGVANLVERHPALFEPESFDVVFCRNILIYFVPDVIARIMDDIHAALRPGGVLCLGHAETPHAGRRFEPFDANGGFYFCKRPVAPEQLAPPAVQRVEAPATNSPCDVPVQVDAALARVRPSPAPPTLDATAWLGDCLGALRVDRIDEATRILETAPESADRNIVYAAILANQGSVAEARATCERLLHASASDAEAHYVLGLCDELEQRTDTARGHYACAAALDEDFAMPRLRLGMLARRRREHEAARRWLGDALRLFPYQTERVLLVFGGGFPADRLSRLCRTEFEACKKSS